MVKKSTLFGSDLNSAGQWAGTVKDSAQQIWLAGLGAFSKAQEEGGKAFEKLVREGVNTQRKTQSVASEKMAEAASTITQVASQINSRASGQWDKLEGIFEDRVAKSLGRLGVPDAQDISALHERIDALEGLLQAASAAAATKTATSPARAANSAPATKAVVKKPAVRVATRAAKTASKAPVQTAAAAQKPARRAPTKKPASGQAS